ncbi:MAG: response regulator [Thermodesulfobacteriota bacterium]
MKGRICIVDHDLASRGYLRECLEGEGYSVTVFENIFQIKAHLTQKIFHVVILNIDSPGIKEKKLLLEIKNANQPKILLIVSERGDAFLKEAIDLGVYGFIHKPFNPHEICTMVTHLVR